MAFLLKNAHVVDPVAGLDGVMDVALEGEKITAVGEGLEAPADAEVVDLTGKYLVPGQIGRASCRERV